MGITKFLMFIVIYALLMPQEALCLRPMSKEVSHLPPIEDAPQSQATENNADINLARITVPRTAHNTKGIHVRPSGALLETCEKIYGAFSEKITIRFSRGEGDGTNEAVYPVVITGIKTEIMTFMKSFTDLGPQDPYTGSFIITIEGPFRKDLLSDAADILAMIIGDERFCDGFDSLLSLRNVINVRVKQLIQFIENPEAQHRAGVEYIGSGTLGTPGSRIVELGLGSLGEAQVMIAAEIALDSSVQVGYIDAAGSFVPDNEVISSASSLLGGVRYDDIPFIASMQYPPHSSPPTLPLLFIGSNVLVAVDSAV